MVVPEIAEGRRIRIETGCGTLVIHVHAWDDKVQEVYGRMKKSGGCATSQNEAIGRLIALCLQNNVAVDAVIDQLQGIRCAAPMHLGDTPVCSCADAYAQGLKKLIQQKVAIIS